MKEHCFPESLLIVPPEEIEKISQQMRSPSFGFRYAQGVRVSRYFNKSLPEKTLYAVVVESIEALFVFTKKDVEHLPETEFLLRMADCIEEAAVSYKYN
jgi:hypothetical protein